MKVYIVSFGNAILGVFKNARKAEVLRRDMQTKYDKQTSHIVHGVYIVTSAIVE